MYCIVNSPLLEWLESSDTTHMPVELLELLRLCDVDDDKPFLPCFLHLHQFVSCGLAHHTPLWNQNICTRVYLLLLKKVRRGVNRKGINIWSSTSIIQILLRMLFQLVKHEWCCLIMFSLWCGLVWLNCLCLYGGWLFLCVTRVLYVATYECLIG